MVANNPVPIRLDPYRDVRVRFHCEAHLMATAMERILHKIVNHLPLNPTQKDELLTEVTAEFGDKEEPESAPE